MNRQPIFRFLMASGKFLLITLAVATSASAADWGDLTAKFVFDGPTPKVTPIAVMKDQEVCGKFGLVEETLVVNPENKGIANVIVFLYTAPTGKAPPVHDSYKELENGKVRFDNKNCRFEPRISAMRTSQTLVAGNLDPVGHNTNVQPLNPKNAAQNVLIPSSGTMDVRFKAAESLPVTVSCNIHPWMKAFVVVKDHPYVGIADKDGKVTIKNIPAGKWTFQFWQESSGFIKDVKLKGKATTWEKGRTELEIKAGVLDLGEVKVAPSNFDKSGTSKK